MTSQRCRQTFRGHVDSVNAVAWQPFTNNLCTGSGDKTVSLWDARSGLCMQVGEQQGVGGTTGRFFLYSLCRSGLFSVDHTDGGAHDVGQRRSLLGLVW